MEQGRRRGRIAVDEDPERDDAVYGTGATSSPENEGQGRRRWRRMVEDTEAPELVDARERGAATPDPGNVPQRGVNQQQQASDEVLDAVERVVSRAIPRRYYGDSAESNVQPPTIYVVPGKFTEGNESAYAPVAVCIGPCFKRQHPRFQNLESYKLCCVRRLIAGGHRGGPGDPPPWTPEARRLLRTCLDTLKRLEPQIGASYGVTFVQNQIAPVMLVDGCFVLHRLLKYARMARRAEQGNGGGGGGGGDEEEDDDWTLVFGQCSVWVDVTCDLLLLQNQIPFFVLRELFEHLKSHPDERDDVLVAGALRLFRTLHPTSQHSSPIACSDVHHLLHLFYLSIISTPTPDDIRPSTTRPHVVPSELPLWIPCAKELEEAGVKFRARKHGATSFLDVRFHGGVLEIPPLRLYDYSEPLFRNLIAFEQTYPATPGHLTAYAVFMDCLVKTPEDMRLLHQSGVLVNQMNGERDATRFFSRICAQAHTSADLNYLAGVMGEVVRYQSSRWPRWRAALVRNYFSNPWVTTSLVAAVFLIALAMLQSFFAAYAYFKPPKQP